MRRQMIAVAFVLLDVAASVAQPPKRDVDLRAIDGTLLKVSYFSAGKPGPAVVLLHMCDGGQRKVWDPLGAMLTARGVHAIAPDYRGYGESGGGRLDDASRREQQRVALELWPRDFDVVSDYLVAQPGVDRSRIGAAGGSCGGGNAVELARRHPEVRTLVLLAGGFGAGREFLPQLPWMPNTYGESGSRSRFAVARRKRNRRSRERAAAQRSAEVAVYNAEGAERLEGKAVVKYGGRWRKRTAFG